MNSEGTHVEEIKWNQDKRNWYSCSERNVRAINIDKKYLIEVLLEVRL